MWNQILQRKYTAGHYLDDFLKKFKFLDFSDIGLILGFQVIFVTIFSAYLFSIVHL